MKVDISQKWEIQDIGFYNWVFVVNKVLLKDKNSQVFYIQIWSFSEEVTFRTFVFVIYQYVSNVLQTLLMLQEFY